MDYKVKPQEAVVLPELKKEPVGGHDGYKTEYPSHD